MILGNLSVRWDLLADAAKSSLVWKAIARQMGPQALRMNLNTLLRHDVFKNGDAIDEPMVDYVANRLSDADEIRRSRQFPYQFLTAPGAGTSTAWSWKSGITKSSSNTPPLV